VGTDRPKPRLAVVWASGCGGCEAAFLDLGERLIELASGFDTVAFPLLADAKREVLEALPEGAIDLCLVSGAIRTDDDLELVATLRRVSVHLVALGACAQLGSILALADTAPSRDLLPRVHRDASAGADGGEAAVAEGGSASAVVTGALPRLSGRVQPLDAAVSVDYVVPGCPPEAVRLGEALANLLDGLSGHGELPPRGSVLGASEAALCEECPREHPTGPVPSLRRLHEVVPDDSRCLLDQGLVCSGPATRGGCGALCPAVGIGCRGCYGPLAGVSDHGARMIGALAALSPAAPSGEPDAQTLVAGAGSRGTPLDPVGTLYRYSYATSLLARLAPRSRGGPCDD